jgi:hypothetical protein
METDIAQDAARLLADYDGNRGWAEERAYEHVRNAKERVDSAATESDRARHLARMDHWYRVALHIAARLAG